jgi:hypothetical protein
MTALRLTGLLRKKPWKRGFFYAAFSFGASDLIESIDAWLLDVLRDRGSRNASPSAISVFGHLAKSSARSGSSLPWSSAWSTVVQVDAHHLSG